MNSTQQLIEFYEMISMNDAGLRESEKTAIVKARLALGMFHRAMESFKRASAGRARQFRSYSHLRSRSNFLQIGG